MQVSAGYKREFEAVVEQKAIDKKAVVKEQDFIDSLLFWFEKEDSRIDLIVAYGICFFVFSYMSLHLVQAVFL